MSAIIIAPGWRLVPALDKEGNPFVYDIYDPSGQWHGSRRTVKQCRLYIVHQKNLADTRARKDAT